MSTIIILASTSPYRKILLDKLQINFTQIAPNTDESPKIGESAKSLVLRLGKEKAQAVAKNHPDAIVIGSDQVGLLDNETLVKPKDFNDAKQQLKKQSGKLVKFYTSIAVVHQANTIELSDIEITTIKFRKLSDTQIQSYLLKERPLNCAGSFKSEGLGISLFDSVTSNDPSALIGLPLIKLVTMLKTCGISL